VRTGWGKGTDSMYVSSVVIFIPSGSAAMILQTRERSAGVHEVSLPLSFRHAIVPAPPTKGDPGR